mmetsp:Transcript_18188/g.40140  ORF Transcript_18188/g.40140 Transcript_18188/m.40140 type:complete len:208 (+) Transcript_18188:351-974(+)
MTQLALLERPRVQLGHQSLVLQGVTAAASHHSTLLGRVQHRLNLVRVDNAAQISVSHHRSGQVVALLQTSRLVIRTKQLGQLLERTLGPHHHAAQRAARGQLSDAHVVHTHALNTRHIHRRAEEPIIRVANEKRPTVDLVLPVAGLALARADVLALLHMLQILVQMQALAQRNHLLGSLKVAPVILDHQWQLVHPRDPVSLRHHQSR